MSNGMGKNCGLRRSIVATLGLFNALLFALPTSAQEAAGGEGELVSIFIAPELYDSAVTSLQNGDFDAANLDISLFLLFNPTNSRAYYVRAISYLQQENLPNALTDFTQSLALGSENDPSLEANTYYLRGGIYAEQRDLDSAIADYSEAITLEPSFDAYFDRAQSYAQQENFAAAIDDLTEALTFDTNNLDVLRFRALLNEELGNYAESAADYVIFFDTIEQDRVQGDALEVGTITAVDASTGVVTELTFEASEGQVFTALAVGRVGENSDPVLLLLDPEGEPLIANDDGTGGLGAFIGDYVLPTDGTYTLLVASGLSSSNGQIGVSIELF